MKKSVIKHPLLRDGFTVLLPVYIRDSPHLFEAALQSVFSNTLLPSEVLVLFDGPVEQSIVNICDRFKNTYKELLKIVSFDKNRGLATVLNDGVIMATNPWVIRADADDINTNDRFYQLANYQAMHQDLDVLGSYINEFDPLNHSFLTRQVPLTHTEIFRSARFRNPINHMSVAFFKPAFLSVGGYPNIYLKEDYALWVLMLMNSFRFANIPLSLVTATAGKDLMKRRGGVKYLRSEFVLQRYFKQIRFKNTFVYLFDFALRSIVFAMPGMMRYLIYKVLLRNKSSR